MLTMAAAQCQTVCSMGTTLALQPLSWFSAWIRHYRRIYLASFNFQARPNVSLPRCHGGHKNSWLLHEEDQGEYSAKISGEQLLRFSLRESATHQNLRIETACRLRSFKNIYNAPSDARRRHI